jgi:hypothetical protein
VVPIEAPPLEVTSDLLLTQQPSLALLSETIPLDWVLDRKVYQGPGGVLIAGWVNQTPATNLTTGFNDGKALWMPTMVLAQQIAPRILKTGDIRSGNGTTKQPLPLTIASSVQILWMLS